VISLGEQLGGIIELMNGKGTKFFITIHKKAESKGA